MPRQHTPMPRTAALRRTRAPTALRAAVALASVALASCATFSPDGGFGPVEQAARQHLGKEVKWARNDSDLDRIAERVAELLARPLTGDDAVQLALLNHRGLQARLQALGISEAELVQASRVPNPGFTFARLKRGDAVELERSLHLNLAWLLARPFAAPLERRRFEQVQREVTMDVLALAAEARRAWVVALAAEETVRYRRQVRDVAEASAELARRMQETGNFNALARAREQGFFADAALGLARAEQARHAARERLVRRLGLWGAQVALLTLPERLPDLPAAPREMPDIERLALAQRLDVSAARLAAEQTASNLGLTRTTRFVNVLELGVERNSASDAPRQTGWELGIELPLFDWGGARVARAEAVYMQALHRVAEVAIDARSEVREAYGLYRAAYDIARHQRDEIVPLRKRISDEQLLRYNGMLIGVFELLADARAQITSVSAAIEAARDFWLAEADLDTALVGKPALVMPAGGPSAATAAADAGGGH